MALINIVKHYHVKPDPAVRDALYTLQRGVAQLLKGNKEMSEALDRLTLEVAEMGEAVDSAITFIHGLADQIRDLNSANDPALNALADELDGKAASLADAIANPGTPVDQVDPPV